MVNQTVWQRSLLVYLAGSEATSSMIVVLAFMAGLGAGALWMGRHAGRIPNPARSLGGVELLLGGANLLVLGLLSLDVGHALQRLQRLTFSLGVPLPLLYALVASAVLLGPCFLMGVTSPLMSEVAQRQLRLRDNRFLVVLFFANTLGAFAGGLATGFQLLPRLGQRSCLAIAIGLNGTAAALLFGLSLRVPRQPPQPEPHPDAHETSSPRGRTRRLDFLALAFGLLALAYEMYLYRVVPLTFEPKPYTFATVLCFYLLFWSIGVLLARWIPWGLAPTLALTALSTLPVPLLGERPWPTELSWPELLLAAGFWLPCLGFGAAFGQLVRQAAVNWGKDVGRIYGWNTIGSCLGILLGVLVGYEAHPAYMVLSIAMAYLLIAGSEMASRGTGGLRPSSSRVLLVATAIGLGLWASELSVLIVTRRSERADGSRIYYGREGVVEVRTDSAMFWNGLGHAPLSRNGSHIGDHNWFQGVLPILSHARARDMDALVVGLGAGATVATMARSTAVRAVEVYEINPRLKRFLADYPEGTLHVGTNPKIALFWQDGRTGLTLSEKRYDIISQEPLYLKQAGSSVLLSREYMQLVRTRLKPGGIYSVYSNAMGHWGQALVVRQTAAGVFRYGESFGHGYLLLMSDSPIDFSRESIERALLAADAGDQLVQEVRGFGIERVAAFLDRPRLLWEGSPVIVTDDHPIVEYPQLADEMVARNLKRLAASPPVR